MATPKPPVLRRQLLKQFPELKDAFTTGLTVHQSKARFAFYDYLQAVYRVHRRWHREKHKRRRSRALARLIGLNNRPTPHPIRILIEATFVSLEAKMASRRTRALQFAIHENVSASELDKFFQDSGGVAACAREAARTSPKRRVMRNAWLEP